MSSKSNVPLGIFGQQEGLYKLYTQICFCFSTDNAIDRDAIVRRLSEGLQRLTSAIPWLAGHVVKTARDDDTSVFMVDFHGHTSRLVVEDYCRDSSIPAMAILKQRGFPMSLLDENALCPRKTLAMADLAAPAEIFLIQLNFVNGGFLLTFTAQHNVMDMTTQAEVIRLFSKACQGDTYTNDEMLSSSLLQPHAVPTYDDKYTPGPEASQYLSKSRGSSIDKDDSSQVNPTYTSSWAQFEFSARTLQTLKAYTSETKTAATDYITTDDALCALTWQAISRARISRSDPAHKTTFARAVDPRKYLDMAPKSPGVVQNMAYHTATLKDVVGKSLGELASDFRSSVDPATSALAHTTRILATLLARSANGQSVSVAARIDPSFDMMLSSWSKYELCNLDFGLGLGVTDAIRRPCFTPCEGLSYLLPKSPDGSIVLVICMRDEDLQNLRADEGFGKWAKGQD